MSILDDTAIFATVIRQAGFARAAAYLGVSNGLVSRRIASLETQLGVTLIKRTTRQLQLTQEGQLLWEHAERIQQELDAAISLIQSCAKKPKGTIRVSAPPYFGRHYLIPIIVKFMANFKDIKVDLILAHQRLDPIKEQLDFVLRGSGYVSEKKLRDSSLKMTLLCSEKIGLYASPEYLLKNGEPKSVQALAQHRTIHYGDEKIFHEKEMWPYVYKNKKSQVILKHQFNCNDMEGSIIACQSGYGIGRFTELDVNAERQHERLRQVLADYDWGKYYLYVMFPNQHTLPRRVRLLLDFIRSQFIIHKN